METQAPGLSIERVARSTYDKEMRIAMRIFNSSTCSLGTETILRWGLFLPFFKVEMATLGFLSLFDITYINK